MIALPILSPITEIQIETLDKLTTPEQISRVGIDCYDRTALIFFIQTHTFIRLAKANPNTKWWDNYIVQANRNYKAYLHYNN